MHANSEADTFKSAALQRTTQATQAAAQHLAACYARLTPAELPALARLYASDAHFQDPFNDVRGVAAIVAIFEHMFATLDAPRFVVTQQLVQGEHAFLGWTFHCRLRGARRQPEQCIEGASLLRFDAQGRVAEHRDHWDAARLYEALPLLGAPMRWLRRRASAPAPLHTFNEAKHADRSPS